ncbi:hypothetical protein C8R44DRAFT_633751, partial [Mycena epipterygia]
ILSGNLTAFLIESYKTSSPDQGQIMIGIMAQISHQLATAPNGSHPAMYTPIPFTPTATLLACNTLWFISLGLSLACALFATLVEQWSRDFIRRTDMRPSPIVRARIFSYLYYELRRFDVYRVVELIPLFLYVSLLLFFAGLIAFLHLSTHSLRVCRLLSWL